MKITSYIVVLLLVCLGLSPAFSFESTSRDWKSIDLKNELITVQVVPKIGGRVIQFKLGDYGFFWVNEQLRGIEPPQTGVGPNGEWLNYGGDKLWPAPQGWDNEQQWPGPPDAVLDGGPYTAEVVKQNGRSTAIQLTSREDKRSGIQFSRAIKIFDDTTHVSIDAAMKNIGTKQRRWGIWSHTQFNAGNRHAEGYNENYWGYCPLNPNSMFPKGYDVIFGLAQNPSFQPDYENRMMRVHYQRRVGKIGLDSDAGWVATVDATDGYVFVQRFSYEKGKEYPDNSSVEFWMNGLGELFAYNRIIKMSGDPIQNPYNFESEMIGPYARLKPGESSSFHYDWYAAKIRANLPILGCSDVGVICTPFTAELRDGRLYLKGNFGVFYNGYISLAFIDQNSKKLDEIRPLVPVTPLKALDLSVMSGLTNGVKAPDKSRKVAIYVYDVKEKIIGELARTQILKN